MIGGRPLVAVLALCGCATPLTSMPKIVRALALPPYQIHEECFALKAGARVEFTFASTEPVDFNIHYHEGAAVIMPISREKSREDAGIYAASLDHDYCLMWEAGPAGATLDYRMRIKPAGS